MKLGFLFGGVALACVIGLAPARADDTIYNDLSGSEIVALLDAHGYQATLTTDQDGDPLIMGATDGLKFRVQTYDCNEQAPRRCRTLQFLAAFAHEASPSDVAAMNDYNNKRVYGRAYINSDGDAAVDFTINLAGGVLAANLMDQVGTWKSYVLDRFVEQLGWKSS